ncbi:hypothetical protein IMCC1933_31090 [Rhodobacteraceae bacterium IMCC1933]|nr:hypothetical protein [Rhodobacteraceae bacterium IMCC1933]
MAFCAVVETPETVGPVVSTVRAEVTAAISPPEVSLIRRFAVELGVYLSKTVAPSVIVSAIVIVPDSPFSAIDTLDTVEAVPPTVTSKLTASGEPDTSSEKPTAIVVPPTAAFCDVIVGRVPSISTDCDAVELLTGSGKVSVAALDAASVIVAPLLSTRLSVPLKFIEVPTSFSWTV